MTRERWELLCRITERFARELRAAEFEPQIATLTASPVDGEGFKITLQYVGPLFESNTFGGAKHGET